MPNLWTVSSHNPITQYLVWCVTVSVGVRDSFINCVLEVLIVRVSKFGVTVRVAVRSTLTTY